MTDGRLPTAPGSRPAGRASKAVSPVPASIPSADDLPHVIGEGTMKLGDLEIKVLQLSSGERVIEEESMNAILKAIFGDSE